MRRAFICFFATTVAGFLSCQRPQQKLFAEEVHLFSGASNRVSVNVRMHFLGNFGPGQEFFFPVGEFFPYEAFAGTASDEELHPELQQAPAGHAFIVEKDAYPAQYVFTLRQWHLHPVFNFSYIFHAPLLEPGTKSGYPAGRYVEYILRSGRQWNPTLQSLVITYIPPANRCDDLLPLQGSVGGQCMPDGSWKFQCSDCPLDNNLRILLPPD